MIDAMFQAGTDRALDDQVQRPRRLPTAEPSSLAGLASAPFRGIGSGIGKTLAFGSDILGAFGQVGGAYPEAIGVIPNEQQQREADAQRAKLLKGGIDYSSEVGDVFRARARETMPDPQATGAAAQVTAGLSEFATQAIGYTLAAGPVAPLLLGGDVGLSEADRLKQTGVDETTRTKAAAVAGGLAALSLKIPMTGATAPIRFAKGAAGGEATLAGQALAERAILEHAGYDKQAATFDPLDPLMLAMGLVPGALGAKFGKPILKPAEVRAAAQLTPAEQAHSDAFERSAANLRGLDEAIKAEKNPDSRATLQAEYDKQAAAHDAATTALNDPDAAPAVRVQQAAAAIDASRLTADADLAGRDSHVRAVESASDMIARGDGVNVAEMISASDLAASHAAGEQLAGLQTEREGLLPVAGQLAEPGAIREARQELRLMEQQRPDVSDQAYRALAKQIQSNEEISYKAALSKAKKQLDDAAQDFQLRQDRLNAAIEQNASAQRATQRLVEIDRSMPQLERQAAPARTVAAVDKLRAAREEAETPPRPAVDNAAVLQVDKEPKTQGPPPPRGSDATAKPEVGQANIDSAADEAATLHPDMMVHLDGMDAPMRVGDLLERLKKDAAEDVRDAKLLEIAANCDLRN